VIEKKEEVSSLENSSGCSHITNEIKDRMQLLGNSGDYDIVLLK
jgi:hypothetical protein